MSIGTDQTQREDGKVEVHSRRTVKNREIPSLFSGPELINYDANEIIHHEFDMRKYS